MPSVHNDEYLEKLFTELPPRCLVLLEDIDAVGIKRRSRKSEDSSSDDSSDEDDDSDSERRSERSGCTLSGLLNVLDGVASQEGRIVLMTSNFPEKLDKALVRPGRVDRMIYLGHISQRSGELMFLRMYAPSVDGAAPADKSTQLPEDELKRLAVEFSKSIPNEIFTPAQLQGYLLNYRDSPVEATANVQRWVREELQTMEAAKEKARKAAELRKKKRRERKQKQAARVAEALLDADSDEELEALRQRKKAEEKARRNAGKKNDGIRREERW
ncbi:hypothetical protein VTK56DRAFT_5044 [Thermocarpiscus australiensis]